MYEGATADELALFRLWLRQPEEVAKHLRAEREQFAIHAKADVLRDEDDTAVLKPERVVPREVQWNARCVHGDDEEKEEG